MKSFPHLPLSGPVFGLPFLLAGLMPVGADVRLPHVFADHMVLQSGSPVPVWGWADPGENLTVSFAGESAASTADASGRWQAELAPLPANALPHDLRIHGAKSDVTVHDVLVGEVWLAGGQSNMGLPLFAAHNAAEIIPQANDPLLRFYSVTKHTAAGPQADGVGQWHLSTPETARNFSAVAYFFAREIRQDRHVPVAVLEAPWGGTDIETWISLEGLQAAPALTNPLARWEKALKDYEQVQLHPELEKTYEADLKLWQKEVGPAYDAATKKYNEDKAAGRTVGPKPQPARPEPTNPDPMGMPSPSRRPSTPTVNYNGMIAPLAPYALRGVIWYQGENNGGRGLEYRDLFPRLIADWRRHWHRPDELPFLFVQLPCNGADPTPVATQGWPWLREAQFLTRKVPHTGMAITIDIGDPNNVHPADKVDVGHRLALLARHQVYGEELAASGPLYHGYQVEAGGKIRVRFTETGGGLTPGRQPWCAAGVKPFPTDRLTGFFVAGADRKWVEAGAEIDGDSVVVSSPQVPEPHAVRYDWANSPRGNLYNKAGLPAAPFRTDDWLK